MKILLIAFITGMVAAILTAIIVWSNNYSFVIPLCFVLATCIVTLPLPIYFIANKLLQKTNWYLNQYGDCVKFRKQKFEMDIVNLGSSPAKYAFDFSGLPISGANWATAPQPISYDFRIIKNYHSYIKKDGILLLLFCPFSGFVKDYEDKEAHKKYHYFLHPILNPHFSETTYEQVRQEVEQPLKTLLRYPFRTLCQMLRFRKNPFVIDKNPMTERQIKKDAEFWFNGWKIEFGLDDLDLPLSMKNKTAIDYNSELLCEIADFCKERSLNPVIVVAPITRYLSTLIPAAFQRAVFYDMIEKAKREKHVPVLDYSQNKQLTTDDLYINSFFLNSKGRKKFTRKVLQDLKLLNMQI